MPGALVGPGPPGPFAVRQMDASTIERAGFTREARSAIPWCRSLLWTFDMLAVVPIRFFMPSDSPAPPWCRAVARHEEPDRDDRQHVERPQQRPAPGDS